MFFSIVVPGLVFLVALPPGPSSFDRLSLGETYRPKI